MKKTIAEDLPARKHPAGAAVQGGDAKEGDHKEKGGKSPEERVRQAVYDIRYRARREELSLQQAYSQYMQNSNMSQQEKTLVKGKLFGKGPMKEDFQIEDFASSTVANALYKVFVEGVKEEEPIRLTYMEKMETSEDRKYKIKVTGKDGRSYVRYATREKISSLRANPNIESVEMTEYGEPYEGEKKKGEQTAAAKAGKDYDGDGKVESGAKEYRGAVHNAIQRRKGGVPDGRDTSNVREAFIGEVNEVDPTTGETIGKPIDVMKGSNRVIISPDVPGSGSKDSPRLQMAHYDMEGPFISETSRSRAEQIFLDLLQERKMTKSEKEKEKKLKAKYDPSDMKASMKNQYGGKKGKDVYFATIRKQAMKEASECECDEKPKYDSGSPCEDDVRSIPTKMNLAKNKLRAMGLKMSYEPESEMVEARYYGRGSRGPLGGEDSDNSPIYRNLGSPTEGQKRQESKNAAKIAERAKAKLAKERKREAQNRGR